MNHTSFKSIVSLLNKSLVLHDAQLKDNPDCYCTKNEKNEILEKCFNCQLKDSVREIQFWSRELKRYTNQSVLFKQFIEAEAFRFALDNSRDFCDVKCYPKWIDPTAELNHYQPDSYEITAWHRMVCGENEIKEYYQVKWNCVRKDELGLAGIPKLLSNWVVDTEAWEIVDKGLPDEDTPEHESDCEAVNESDWIVKVYNDEEVVDQWTIDGNRTESQATKEAEADIKQLNSEKFTDWTMMRELWDDFSMCNCAEYAYYHTEEYIVEDFIANSIEYLLEYELPEPEFDGSTRKWTLGYCEFDLEEFQKNDFYKTEANYNNGAPYTN